ncbi:MAG: endonuclease Q family protein [Patescibacteria group bacterium]|nr:endonuclease Q family protein [Patescibacteria group bacterium]MCL5262142.1 endonuclease Q family protein [Patescibacteria group bacterium]
MKFIADFHIHSAFSRAVSRDMTFDNLGAWGKKKGLKVIGTGDFTHPRWLADIESLLEPAEPGLYKLRSGDQGTRFLLTAEISSIYSRAGATRRVHNLVFAPDVATVKKINEALLKRGANLLSDGRPIIGLDSEELVKIILEADSGAAVVPAHAWTPWFSVFGSMSGFDSLEECYGEQTKNIFAIETGLSSDPSMNWRLSELDGISLISNSDSHSLQRLGREANIFDTEFSYSGVMEAIRSRDKNRFLMTIEFFPEEGKYHFDGNRACGISLSPEETMKLKGICPACGKSLTIGVLNRVYQLADRPAGYTDPRRVPYKNLIPLDEIVAEAYGVGTASKKVKQEYERIVSVVGDEIEVLMDKSESELSSGIDEKIVEGIMKVRRGEVKITPGYDGEYGKIRIFGVEKASTLF